MPALSRHFPLLLVMKEIRSDTMVIDVHLNDKTSHCINDFMQSLRCRTHLESENLRLDQTIKEYMKSTSACINREVEDTVNIEHD